MRRPIRLALPLVTLVLATCLVGCQDDVPPGQATATPGATAAVNADGSPAELMKLSTQEEARYADIAITPDGTLHAIMQDKNTKSGRPQVYYRSSADGGASWGAAVNLLEDDLTNQAGFIRLVADGAGRVYAFWKTYQGFDVVEPSGGSVGTLTYRVLDHGAWSPPTTVGTTGEVVGWCPAVGADGALKVAWSEPTQDGDGRYRPDWQASRILTSAVDGATVAAPKPLFEAPAVSVTDTVINYDGYRGLSGYLDAAGAWHLVALKTVTKAEVGAPSTPSEVVLWDGAAWKTLFPTGRFEAISQKLTTSPPVLYRDAAGAEHLLMLNQALDKPALQDYRTNQPDAPTTVYQIQSDKGGIGGFQASVGANGRLAAFLEMHDATDKIHPDDLVAFRFDGAAWQPPVNVTANAAREAFVDTQVSKAVSVSKLVTYSARYGAGAFDPQGKLATVFVNVEKVTIMDKADTANGYSGAFGSNSSTHAYFQKI